MSDPAPDTRYNGRNGTCRFCGGSLEGKRESALHCNDKCRVNFHLKSRRYEEITNPHYDRIEVYKQMIRQERIAMIKELRAAGLEDICQS